MRLVSPLPTLAISFCITWVVYALTLNLSILNPSHVDWALSSDSDATVYFFSFAYYRHAPWSFPLTHFQTLFYPVGTSISLMDGLPLVAVPLKLFNRLLPARFQFLGLWLFLCIWLQAFFAERFLRMLKLPSLYCWSGAVFAAIAPPFVGRFGHVALSSHWLLIAMMAAVCAEVPGIALWLLPILALWVHPYLFAMVTTLSIAGHLRFARARGALWRALAMGGGLVASLWVLGYFQMSETKGRRFEYYSSDLSSLFNGMGAARLLPGRLVAGGAYEGAAYLGCGGLVLLAVLVVTCCVPRWRRSSGQNPWLLVPALGMALYSLSTAPHYLGQTLTELNHLASLIEPISSRFRSCGRFIWPLYYYLLFFGFKALHQLLSHRPALRWLAPALLALQTVDVWPGLVDKVDKPGGTEANVPDVPASISAQLTPETRFIIFVPPVKVACDRHAWRGPYQQLAAFGALHGLTSNANLGQGRSSPKDTATVCRYTLDMYRHRAEHPEAIFIKR